MGRKNVLPLRHFFDGLYRIKHFSCRLTIVFRKEAENEFKIYDIEKTVIDIIYYRNKIGIEQTKEILLNYLSLPQHNLNKLHQYAKLLNCEKILNTYMEVLI